MTPIVLGEFEQLVLLAILRLDAAAYGVTIVAELEKTAGRQVSRGALYTTLLRMEQKGLLRWRIDPGTIDRDGLPRRCYTVSDRGLGALRATRQVLRRMWSGLEDVLKERA